MEVLLTLPTCVKPVVKFTGWYASRQCWNSFHSHFFQFFFSKSLGNLFTLGKKTTNKLIIVNNNHICTALYMKLERRFDEMFWHCRWHLWCEAGRRLSIVVRFEEEKTATYWLYSQTVSVHDVSQAVYSCGVLENSHKATRRCRPRRCWCGETTQVENHLPSCDHCSLFTGSWTGLAV